MIAARSWARSKALVSIYRCITLVRAGQAVKRLAAFVIGVVGNTHENLPAADRWGSEHTVSQLIDCQFFISPGGGTIDPCGTELIDQVDLVTNQSG